MEEIGATIPKYHAAIVSFMVPVVRLRMMNHPFPPNSPVYWRISTFIDRRINIPKLIEISSAILLIQPYKCFPVTTKNFMRQSFLSFFLSSFIFIAHFFRGLAGAFVNPGSFLNSLYIYSLVCLITHSFLHGFQPNLYQHFSYVCSTCHTIFSLK